MFTNNNIRVKSFKNDKKEVILFKKSLGAKLTYLKLEF